MSKNFSNYLSQAEETHEYQGLEVFDKNEDVSFTQLFFSGLVSQGALALMTQPFTVVHSQLQMSITRVNIPIDMKAIFDSSMTLAQKKKIELIYKNHNPLPYASESYSNYRQAFRGIANQGIMAFFKGFGSGLAHTLLNSQLRFQIIQKLHSDKHSLQSLYACSTAALVDLITNPIMLIQSRMILQHRQPNLRTYQNIRQLIRSTPIRQFYQGSTTHLYKNLILLFSQLPAQLLDNKQQLLYLLITQSIVTYPFLTVVRRLHCQSNLPFMITPQYSGPIDAFKKIYLQEGIRKLYSGFTAFAIVNGFMSLVLYSTQILGEQVD